jgi:aminoglycoside phosphotransferase (APT) family kinase protein
VDSLSKSRISDAIQAIVRSRFGSSATVASLSELSAGYSSVVHRIGLADGSVYVLKVAPDAAVQVMRFEVGVMAADVRVLRLVRALTHLPVPAVICHDTSGSIIPNEYFIMQFMPGTSLLRLRGQLTANQNDTIQRQVGACLRKINNITGQRFGAFAHPEAPGQSWRAAFRLMAADVLADGADKNVQLPIGYADVYALLAAHYDALDGVTTPQLVHWDMWDANVLLDPATMQVTGLIDFECALWGDPLIEWNFAAPSPAFLEGYGRALPFTHAERTRRALYDVYLYLAMVIGCYYYEREDSLEPWARQKLAEALVHLQTITV